MAKPCGDEIKPKNADPDDVGGVEPPGEDESYEAFMDRCSASADQASCQTIWNEKALVSGDVVHKVHLDVGKAYSPEGGQLGLEFILSDMTPDRYDDVIVADGWDLQNFQKNPIALFNHNPDFPVGRWEGLNIKDGALRGHLKMAPIGTSPRHDELHKLIDAGILRAVSVGFRPIESKPRGTSGGLVYTKSELVETSLVSVPANPNALLAARSMRISDATLNLVFAEHGTKAIARDVGNTVLWRGETVPVRRYPDGEWGGQKLYRY
jgi:HK97 family phage prohead protease